MTHKEQLVELFRRNGNCLSLGQILQYPFGYEARARFTELRREGYTITLERGKTASENIYRMIEPYTYDATGQAKFA